MSTNNKHKISEKELDNLLNQAFLNLDFNNPKNEKLMETISSQVLPVHPTSQVIINKVLLSKIFVFIAVIGLSVMIYFNYQNKSETTHPQSKTTVVTFKEDRTEKNDATKNNLEIITQVSQKNYSPKPIHVAISRTIEPQHSIQSNIPQNPLANSLNYIQDEKKTKSEDSTYVFPKLTEKEIKATIKQKEKMINWLMKKSKDKWALIKNTDRFSGDTYLNEDSLGAFYIQTTEVSNLEYRTFLFDLLINDRKTEFLIAKPYQNLWLSTLGTNKYDAYKDVYFSDNRFDNYPVVNISKEGAELYCQWLSSLSKKGYPSVRARLPYENEWLYAAKGGVKTSYPWNRDSIQNANGCYMTNFCIQKNTDKLNPRKHIKCSGIKDGNAYTSGGMMLGDSVLTVVVNAYNPNNFGLYCVSGNVAEMVYNTKTKTIRTKGGSWNSDFEHCKLNAEEDIVGTFKANTTTGFRPIFRINSLPMLGTINREDPKTGLPTMTEDEIQANQKQKKKMIDAAINFSKTDYAHIPMGSCIYKNDTVSVQSFYMQTTEVTNLQYKTFLFDLLIQGRTDDYIEAKPNQKAWQTKFPYSFNDPLVNLYFAHPAYDEYPVVNISRKAAEMYCTWLTVECNKVLKEKNKPLINDFRIPVDIEWAYAANNRYKAKYASGHDQLKDAKGKYEMNYMCFSKEQCKYDSIRKMFIPKQPLNKDEKLLAAFTDDGGFHTVFTKSYQPNSYGLYCMAGNVSEMVYKFDLKNKKISGKGTKGGSWFSCDYFLEIDANEEWSEEFGPSPLIGFRPVITALVK